MRQQVELASVRPSKKKEEERIIHFEERKTSFDRVSKERPYRGEIRRRSNPDSSASLETSRTDADGGELQGSRRECCGQELHNATGSLRR